MEQLPLRSHSRTDRGLVHGRNEDQSAVFDTPEGGRVLLVCDGMGGMGRGDEASRLAIESLQSSLTASEGRPNERMRAAIREADARIRNELTNPGDSSQPGSTAVMVWVHGAVAYVGWVGDSRAYLIRGSEVVGRTRDHKLVEDLVEAGQMTAADARNSSLAHVVTRALGGKGPLDPGVKPANLASPWRLMHGDRILVCSDGLTDLVEDSELPTLFIDEDLEATSQRMVDTANERGGHDNITCVVAVWDGPDWVDDGTLLDDEEEEEAEAEPTSPEIDLVEVGSAVVAQPPDMGGIARELMPWWIAAAVLLLCALIAAAVAGMGA